MVFPKELKNKFKGFLSSRAGLYFKDHDLQNLETAILKRMELCGFDTIAEYYSCITTSSKKQDEFRELLNLLTINHTYFFRNEPQFKALQHKVLPEIMERKNQSRTRLKPSRPSLRIWSAGCSTGEEPYSIAMAVRDVIKKLDEWDIEIFATDASTYALERAKAGIYSENSMRLVDRQHRINYFTAKTDSERNSQWAVCNAIKNMAHFDYLNLMDENIPAGFDIIFCRNVVIYFELETKIEVMNRLYSSLADNGYLFIGYSENLQFMYEKFRMLECADTIVYRKLPQASIPQQQMPKSAAEKAEETLDNLSNIQLQVEKRLRPEREIETSQKTEQLLSQITKAVHLKEYNRALLLIKGAEAVDKNAVDLSYLAAEIYVNQGNFKQAKERLHQALKLNSLFAPAYYLLGSIYIEEEDLEEAKENLKRALYLAKEFIWAHFNLAMVYRKQGRIEQAYREYKNTLKLLAKSSPADIIAHSGGFSTAALIGICNSNIERLQQADVGE